MECEVELDGLQCADLGTSHGATVKAGQANVFKDLKV